MKANEILKKIREELGYKNNRAKFARDLNVSEWKLKNIELQRQEKIPDSIKIKLMEIFNINPNYLLTGEGSMFLEPTEEERKEAHQIADDWQAKLNLTDQELSLLIDKLSTDKEMFILMAKSLSGDSTALERLKKLIC